MDLFDLIKFSHLKIGLTKTRNTLLGKLQKVLSGKSKIDDELLEHLEEILLGADVGIATTMEIIRRVRERVKKESYENPAEFNTLLRDEIHQIFVNGNHSTVDRFVNSENRKPQVIMVVGVNGVGKTTTIGKLAHLYKTSGKNVLIAAADTFRAAANEQLEIWAQRAGVEIVQAGKSAYVADPAAVAFDALKAAIARGADVMIIDTAGRLHTRVNLMEELRKIKRVLQKQMPQALYEVLLVLDASIGQNAIQQAKQFNEVVGVTGLVITKLDGTAKGGVVLAICNELKIPVKFICVGEKIDDIQPFDRRLFVEALFER